jgi:hypothetical protein
MVKWKESKRNGCGLIPNTTPAITWRNCGKSWKTSVQEKWLWSNSKYYPSSYLEELWEIRENLSPREMVMV